MSNGLKYDIDLILTRLVEVIKESGLSYGELSKRTGIPKSSIHRYANGTTKKIPIDAVRLIATAVGVPTSYIMGWKEENTEIIHSPEETKLTEGEKKCLELYNRISEDSKELFINMLEAFDKVNADSQPMVAEMILVALKNQR